VAQGRTVHTGLALITGTEDRPHAYVALSRGARHNAAYVLTESPRLADPGPGARPAPELDRFDRARAYRDSGLAPVTGDSADAEADVREQALGVLAQVISRDGEELSATETRLRGLSNADHLAILHAIWASETTPSRERRYQGLLEAALPPGYQAGQGHRTRWLWRTLRAAELAGLDPADVLREAVAQRSLADARDVAAVLDSRIRRRTRTLVPLAPRPWSEQVPELDSPARRDYVAEVARLMDERAERIGEHAAEHAVGWAVRALGPIPDDPPERLGWQRRASAIGAYRELYGWDHPAEPIGPEPSSGDPDRRAAWHYALAVLGPADGEDVRGQPDGMLLHLRDTYPVQTAWAPRWVGDELRQVRLGGSQARLAAIRAAAETTTSRRQGRDLAAARHAALAASYQAMARAYDEREVVLAGVMDDRRAWEQATASRRRLAVAADAELRRRHPGQHYPPLRSAEPGPVTSAERASLRLAPGEPVPEISGWISDLRAGRPRFARQLASRQASGQAGREHDDDIGPAFASWADLGDDALLQPPRPQIRPSARVLDRATERDAGMEAAR
jgi:hypothetical protein